MPAGVFQLVIQRGRASRRHAPRDGWDTSARGKRVRCIGLRSVEGAGVRCDKSLEVASLFGHLEQ